MTAPFVPTSSTSSLSATARSPSSSSSSSSLLRHRWGWSRPQTYDGSGGNGSVVAGAATATADIHKKDDDDGNGNGNGTTRGVKDDNDNKKQQDQPPPNGGAAASSSPTSTSSSSISSSSAAAAVAAAASTANPRNDAQKLHWKDLTRLKPWVLVPQGSMNGFFDYVPLPWRVGPWSLTAQLYMLLIAGAVVAAPVYWLSNDPGSLTSYLERISQVRYDDDTQLMRMDPRHAFLYNVGASLWMVRSMVHLLHTSPLHHKIWATYTIQSWTMLSFRHVLSSLAYAYPTSQIVALAELSRFPAACSATITFGVWNVVVMPFIYYVMRVPDKRQAFVKFCFSPRLLNIHGLNIVLAIMNGAYATPRRSLEAWDFYLAFVSVVVYMAFYLLVLDRIGVHLYAVFSPRAPSAVVVSTWTLLIGLYAATFAMWKHVMMT